MRTNDKSLLDPIAEGEFTDITEPNGAVAENHDENMSRVEPRKGL